MPLFVIYRGAPHHLPLSKVPLGLDCWQCQQPASDATAGGPEATEFETLDNGDIRVTVRCHGDVQVAVVSRWVVRSQQSVLLGPAFHPAEPLLHVFDGVPPLLHGGPPDTGHKVEVPPAEGTRIRPGPPPTAIITLHHRLESQHLSALTTSPRRVEYALRLGLEATVKEVAANTRLQLEMERAGSSLAGMDVRRYHDVRRCEDVLCYRALLAVERSELRDALPSTREWGHNSYVGVDLASVKDPLQAREDFIHLTQEKVQDVTLPPLDALSRMTAEMDVPVARLRDSTPARHVRARVLLHGKPLPYFALSPLPDCRDFSAKHVGGFSATIPLLTATSGTYEDEKHAREREDRTHWRLTYHLRGGERVPVPEGWPSPNLGGTRVPRRLKKRAKAQDAQGYRELRALWKRTHLDDNSPTAFLPLVCGCRRCVTHRRETRRLLHHLERTRFLKEVLQYRLGDVQHDDAVDAFAYCMDVLATHQHSQRVSRQRLVTLRNPHTSEVEQRVAHVVGLVDPLKLQHFTWLEGASHG